MAETVVSRVLSSRLFAIGAGSEDISKHLLDETMLLGSLLTVRYCHTRV